MRIAAITRHSLPDAVGRRLALRSGQLQGTHPDGGNQTREQNTGEPDNHGEQAGEETLRHQIAVANGKRGDECEIERIAQRPSLKKADKRPQHELKGHEP